LRARQTERGFAETTVADIAAQAGVSAATIYATFGSKAGVVTAMVEDMEEAVRADVEPPAGTDEDPRVELRAWSTRTAPCSRTASTSCGPHCRPSTRQRSPP
jgi:AcrR family transcriptional regulator